MITHYKKKAVIECPIGLALLIGGIFLGIKSDLSPWVGAILGLTGFFVYGSGCVALARGKGYSSAIILTVVLGVLFPFVVLLALDDKNKHRHRRR